MSNLKEVSYLRNFTMLTQKLHSLFLQYIIEGRKRAPPEMKLTDLISTFQFGAKTDRRALQSKFKSWAKRMMVENNTLKLKSSKKEIVPLEKCKDLIMQIHFDGHQSVNKVISKIQERYTWSKKNFGMDSFMVLNCISMNCLNSSCKQNIETEISKREKNFMKDLTTSSDCHLHTIRNHSPKIPNNSRFINPTLCAWPIVFHMSNNENCLSFEFQTNNVLRQNQTFIPSDVKYSQNNYIQKIGNKPILPQETFKVPDKPKIQINLETKRKLRSAKKTIFGSSGTFRKPKYIHEFKALVGRAEKVSSVYSSILNETKTKFLSNLDLVPKKIISKKTLLTFEREKRKKKVVERQHMLYHKNRKNLRDRNKLNKIKLKQQREKPAYLDVLKLKRNRLYSSTDLLSNRSFDEVKTKNNELVESLTDKVLSDDDIEIVKIVSKPQPETIQLSSSEDEKNVKNVVPDFQQNNYKPINYSHSFDNDKNRKIEHYSSPHTEINYNDQFINKISIKKSSDGTYTSSIPPLTRNSLTVTSINNCNTNFKRTLIPPNKGEIAVLSSSLPSMRYIKLQEYPSFPSLPTGCTSIPSILRPISTIGMSSQNYKGDSGNLYPSLGNLSSDTKVFLVEKTANGTFKMVSDVTPSSSFSMNTNIVSNSKEFEKDLVVSKVKVPPMDDSASKTTQLLKAVLPNVKNSELYHPRNILKTKRRLLSDEMDKLLWWIRKTKMSMMHTLFHNNIERSSMKMKSQLNTGITIVRNVRRTLIELENLEMIWGPGNSNRNNERQMKNFYKNKNM